VMSGLEDGLAVAFMVGALVSGIAYTALFLLLAVVTRHAVIVGLMYALIWEGLVGGLVPGAQRLSVQQWGLAIAERLTPHPAVDSSVGLVTGIVLLVAVTLAATLAAGERLRSLTLSEAE